MVSIWWGVRGNIHWELLPTNYTITADLYCQQLDRVAAKLRRKQNGIYFFHDNDRFYIAKSTREKLLKLGWVTTPHSSYSPHLTPMGYHLFRSLSNHSKEKSLMAKTAWKWTASNSSAKSRRPSTNTESFPYQSVDDKS